MRAPGHLHPTKETLNIARMTGTSEDRARKLVVREPGAQVQRAAAVAERQAERRACAPLLCGLGLAVATDVTSRLRLHAPAHRHM